MIRWKVFLPALGLILSFLWLSTFRLDLWVKGWMEEEISSITQTRTDIDHLRISLLTATVNIRKIEIASNEEEYKNAVELQDVFIGFELLPLLKKRFVVSHFDVQGIAWGTPRTSSGKIGLPSFPVATWYSKVAQKSFKDLQKESDEIPVSRLLDFRIPMDASEALTGLTLQGEEAYKSVVLTGQDLRSNWKTKIDELLSLSQYKARLDEARALVKNTPDDPQEISRRARSLLEVVEFFQSEKKKLDLLCEEAKKDHARIQSQFDTSKAAQASDYKKALGTISLESVHLDHLSQILFGPYWISRAENVFRLRSGVRKFFAKAQTEGDVQIRPRALGREILYISPASKPDFVLADSRFTMKGLEGGAKPIVTQLYKIQLTDLNSDPLLYGKASSADFHAELKDLLIGEADIHALWDYTKPAPKEEVKAKLSRIKAQDWPVGIAKIFPVKMISGMAEADTTLSSEGDDTDWKAHVQFHDVSWDLTELPKVGMIVPLLADVLSQTRDFSLDFEVKGSKSGVDYQVTSDLDPKLKASILQAIGKPWSDFEDRLKIEIDTKLGKYENEASKEFDDFKTNVSSKLDESRTAVQKFVEEATQLQTELQKRSGAAVADRAPQEAGKSVAKPQ